MRNLLKAIGIVASAVTGLGAFVGSIVLMDLWLGPPGVLLLAGVTALGIVVMAIKFDLDYSDRYRG